MTDRDKKYFKKLYDEHYGDREKKREQRKERRKLMLTGEGGNVRMGTNSKYQRVALDNSTKVGEIVKTKKGREYEVKRIYERKGYKVLVMEKME